jgi:hypothetical protein
MSDKLLNQDAINDRRISVEDANLTPGKPGVFLCHYCTRRFGNESIFMRHECEQKKRAYEIASPVGQAGFIHYTAWMKLKKFKAQSIDAFMSSRYYRAFLRFAEMVITAGISKPERYIQLMVDGGITPDLWHRDQCYKMYLDWMDNQEDPLSQVASSIMCLMDLAEKEEVDYRKIVEHLGAQRILSLIGQRKLSPWFLLHSSAVQAFLKGLDPEHLKNFDRAINIGAWVERLQENKDIRAEIKQVITEVGL